MNRVYWVETHAFGAVFRSTVQDAAAVCAAEIGRRFEAGAGPVGFPRVWMVVGRHARVVDLEEWSKPLRERFYAAVRAAQDEQRAAAGVRR